MRTQVLRIVGWKACACFTTGAARVQVGTRERPNASCEDPGCEIKSLLLS